MRLKEMGILNEVPIRRSQLIAPFGVGAMIVVSDGRCLICGGLDHWYKYEDGNRSVDIDEFSVGEWRLSRQLRVDHFRMPPDFRRRRVDQDVPNTRLTVPFLRFPQWHHCPYCKRLYKRTLFLRDKEKCPMCLKKHRKIELVQVPFVAMCDHGHIQDFPWIEWVHRSETPNCSGQVYLYSTGGATLAAQIVKCDCGSRRSLASITRASGDTTYLTTHLIEGKENEFRCQGKRPWLGLEGGEGCDRPLRGSLRSASNVYYAHVRSAIYLPRGNEEVPSALVSLLEEPPLSTYISALESSDGKIDAVCLRKNYAELLNPFSDKEIKGALGIVLTEAGGSREEQESIGEDDEWTAFRRTEFNILRKDHDSGHLCIKSRGIIEYDARIEPYFSRIMLLEKLRETRVLAGFTRILPESGQNLQELRALMRRDEPRAGKSWLPAYVVYGEGIYLELNEDLLRKWAKEFSNSIARRIRPLAVRYQQTLDERNLPYRSISARFVLVHTLAHLLMNQLTYECGYSSASLRERLYVSENQAAPMAGLLIYTAAGDSEGTMGGLVRMGKPGNLEPTILRALDRARWCSADPVCMEMGLSGGQGPDSLNLAACHNCGLVPETACEEFNRLLDRALVIGDLSKKRLGFFDFALQE